METENSGNSTTKPTTTYKYPSVWTCVKSGVWYFGQLCKKFLVSVVMGIAITPCFELLSWFMINFIFRKKNVSVESA